MNAIETHHLTRRFGRAEAVHDLSLVVPQGSVFALLGANGAGKTTTIKLLMNLLAPTGGEARVLGVDSRKLSPRERSQIGYVSENQQLPLWMTVRQFLDFCRPLYPTWDSALERALLEKLALPPQRKLKHLSRGMLMKASLLSSLAYRPKLLVLDEPFSGLDPLARDEFTHGLLEAAGAGETTVVVASHDIEEVERLCDRIALLDGGRLRLADSTESLLNRFRRVEITGATAQLTPNASVFAGDWLEFESRPGLVRFITPRHLDDATQRECAARFPGGSISAHPLTLREIFVAIARAGSASAKKEAA